MKAYRLFYCVIAGVCLLISTLNGFAETNTRLGGMRLLEGYEHEVQQGIDSVVGRISKKGGLQINYEIGAVSKPGEPRFGGQFSDRPQLTPKEQLRWYREQLINGQPVHLAYRKDNVLLVSFPQKGTNFRVAVESPETMADALLMILTYPSSPKHGEQGAHQPATAPDSKSEKKEKPNQESKPRPK